MGDLPTENLPPTARYVAISAFVGVLILPMALLLSFEVDTSLSGIGEILEGFIFLGVGGFFYGIIGGIYAGIKLSDPDDPKPHWRELGCWFASAAVIIPLLSVALFFLLFAIDAPNWQ